MAPDHRLTLLCLNHLSWEHVWQRPQHLMTRFAGHCRVIYVDPPELVDGAERPHLVERPGTPDVRVIRPIFVHEWLGQPGRDYRDMWLSVLPDVLAEAGPNTVLWVSSPLLDYVVAAAVNKVKLTVYDCMDDLASFRGGNTAMREREARLLGLVDLLFTGGPSMHEARKAFHPRAYCFPSGVDLDHYRRVADPDTSLPASIAWIPQPRLGYFGVLDERIDWELIAEVAHRRPEWHWVLVGPTAKVHPAELPGSPNIHYLGKQQYHDLPAFLKGFDVATMPFALNEATRSISPTKTLEYLAGGKAVISSSVPDVVVGYSEIVTIADGWEAWIGAIAEMLAATPEQRQARLDLAAPILDQSSWDSIASRMWDLIEERLRRAHEYAS